MNKKHAEQTINRLHKAASEGDHATVAAIADSLDLEHAKYLVMAMALALFGDMK